MSEVKKFFSPEFLNRIDDTIMFNPLSTEDINKITKIELDKSINRINDLKYKIAYTDSVIEHLSKIGYDEKNGARPLKRAIQNNIEDLVSDEILNGIITTGNNYTIDVVNDEITIINK